MLLKQLAEQEGEQRTVQTAREEDAEATGKEGERGDCVVAGSRALTRRHTLSLRRPRSVEAVEERARAKSEAVRRKGKEEVE